MGFLGKLFGRDPEKLYAQAMELVDQGRYDKAVQKLEVAGELNPDSPQIWFSLGFCYSRLISGKEDDEAELLPVLKKSADAFQNAVDLAEAGGGLDDNQISKASFSVGIFYQQQKNCDKSVEYLENAAKRNPKDHETKLFLSTSYLFQGRADDADSLALQVLESDPTNIKFLAHWKELRKMAGKEAIVDLPEEQRRKIYADFMETKDTELLLGTDLAADFGRIARGDSSGGLAKMHQSIRQNTEKARKAATEAILGKYGLKQFQLVLIEEEGKEKEWEFRAVTR